MPVQPAGMGGGGCGGCARGFRCGDWREELASANEREAAKERRQSCSGAGLALGRLNFRALRQPVFPPPRRLFSFAPASRKLVLGAIGGHFLFITAYSVLTESKVGF